MADPTVEPIIPTGTAIKQYHAIFTQTGTNHPVVTTLHNTLGEEVTWLRLAVGIYEGTCYGKFTNDKTLIETHGGTDAGGRIPIRPLSHTPTGAFYVNMYRYNDNKIMLIVYTSANADINGEFSTMGGTYPIKVNVYK